MKLVSSRGGKGLPNLDGYHMRTCLQRMPTGELILTFAKNRDEPRELTLIRVFLMEARTTNMDLEIGDWRGARGFSPPRTTACIVHPEPDSPRPRYTLSVLFEAGSLSIQFSHAYYVITTEELEYTYKDLNAGRYLTGPRAEEAEPDYAGYRLDDVALEWNGVQLELLDRNPDRSDAGWINCIFKPASRVVFSQFKPRSIVQSVSVNLGGGRIPSYRFSFADGAFIEVEAKRVFEVRW